MVVAMVGRPLLNEILGQTGPFDGLEQKRRFSMIFARSALAVTPSEIQLPQIRESPIHTFQ